ncbi:proline-rich family protein [Rhodotorula toruloides]|uniref:Proline-rich family protein n=1 Tax=Rhodotorula toruloides TaxID=5286 RepID=A0A511K9E0_RHOTO|nr:proline-rich family protein [Rhodotorula toruloides]
MAKSSNPVDAHRKAQRKAELKKNKQRREQAKEVATVKKDTKPIEADIRRLSQHAQKAPLSKAEKDELASLRAELSRIKKAKEEYVAAHPEHRKFVFPDRPSGDNADDLAANDEPSGLYDKQGRLKHPERSFYYDPVYNPYGAPPPGMPYREKHEYAMARMGIPTLEEMAAFRPVGEEDDSEEDEEDEDEDIVMPAGPPPGEKVDDSDSDDDDIPLPPGPPPPRALPVPHATTSRVTISRPSRPSGPPIPPHALPPRPAFPPHAGPPPPGAPPGPRNPRLPARPPPPGMHMQDPLSEGGPNRAFQQGRAIGPVQPAPPASPPLGSAAHAPPSGPSPFFNLAPAASSSSAAAASSSATISAAPQLRDLKKEATAFVPSAMRKKMAQQKARLDRAGLTSIDAARGAGGSEGAAADEVGEPAERKKTLMEEMRERGIGVGAQAKAAGSKADTGMDDYARFQEEMKDFL